MNKITKIFLKQFDLFHRIKGINKKTSVLLSPTSFTKYEAIFKSADIPFTVVEDNFQKYIYLKNNMHKIIFKRALEKVQGKELQGIQGP